MNHAISLHKQALLRLESILTRNVQLTKERLPDGPERKRLISLFSFAAREKPNTLYLKKFIQAHLLSLKQDDKIFLVKLFVMYLNALDNLTAAENRLRRSDNETAIQHRCILETYPKEVVGYAAHEPSFKLQDGFYLDTYYLWDALEDALRQSREAGLQFAFERRDPKTGRFLPQNIYRYPRGVSGSQFGHGPFLRNAKKQPLKQAAMRHDRELLFECFSIGATKKGRDPLTGRFVKGNRLGFQKGHSGNPKGRPNNKTLLEKYTYQNERLLRTIDTYECILDELFDRKFPSPYRLRTFSYLKKKGDFLLECIGKEKDKRRRHAYVNRFYRLVQKSLP